MEGLDVCLAEPEEELFGLWLQGLPLDHAVKRRLALMQEAIRRSHYVYPFQQQAHHADGAAAVSINRSTSSSSSLLMGSSATVAALVAEDTVDDFRSFDAMESYLYQPDVFVHKQALWPLPFPTRRRMVEAYYTLDEGVVRELVWRRLPSSTATGTLKRGGGGGGGGGGASGGRDLEETAGVTGVALRSCRRQHDNLRRVCAHVEEQRGYACRVLVEIERAFLLPTALASEYTTYLFLSFHRFEIAPPSYHQSPEARDEQRPQHPADHDVRAHPPSATAAAPPSQQASPTQALSFRDLEFMSLALLMLCGPPFTASSSVSTGMPSQTPITALSTLDDVATPGPGSFSPNFAAGSGPGGYAAVPTSSSRGRGDSLTSSSMAGVGGGEGRAVGDVTRALMQVLAVMLPEEGVVGAAPVSGGPMAYELLQGLLRDIYGVDLEKQLLACLKELSRVFNDAKVLEQYQVEALKVAAGQGGGDGYDDDNGQQMRMDPRRLPAVEKRFRTLLRHLSALGWGLSQQRELKDFFDDVLSKVAQPLREAEVSRQDLVALFLSLAHALPTLPGLAERAGVQQRRIKHYAVSWARFTGAVLLCLLHTFDKWSR